VPGAFVVGPGDADAWGNTPGQPDEHRPVAGAWRQAMGFSRLIAQRQDGSMDPVLIGASQALAAPGRDGRQGRAHGRGRGAAGESARGPPGCAGRRAEGKG
jgi:hypothetical protein